MRTLKLLWHLLWLLVQRPPKKEISVRFWQSLFGGSASVAYVMVLALGCSHSQGPAAVADFSPECRAAEADARILRVEGQMTPEDVEAIMIQTDPQGFETVQANYGPGIVKVETLASWSCLSSSGEQFFLVREGSTWRALKESYVWTSIIN
jgi:hypothetical protein